MISGVNLHTKRGRPRAETASRQIAWVGPPLLVAAFVALLGWSWRKWPDALVDFGRELYVPWQLAAGKLLYLDIAYFNGPLSPWLNSTLFRAFGTSLMTLVTANLVILVAVGAMLYALVRKVATPFTATIGTLVFLTVFAFGQYMPQGNYNFVTPYSHEMTHGTALALAALLLLSVHLRRAGKWSAFACGLAAGLTLLTKAEFFLAVSAALVTGLGLHHWHRRTPLREIGVLGAAVGAGLLLPATAAFLVLRAKLPADLALQGVLGSWAYAFVAELSESKLYRDIMGTADPGQSLCIIGAWSVRYAAFLLPPMLIGLFLRRSWRYAFPLAVLLTPLAALAVLADWRATDWGYIARPFPLAMLIVTGLVSFGSTRPAAGAEQRLRRVLSLSCVVFALALLPKMFLNVRFIHYGFALAMPSAVVLVVVLLEVIPDFVDRRGGYGTAFRAASLGILAAVMGMHLYASNTWFRLRTVRVGQDGDAFLTDARGRVLEQVLVRLEQSRNADQTLAVLPEGVMINYLARMPNPTPYVNFMPPEIIMFGEGRMVQAFAANPPDWIVLTDRHAPEYGYELLGTDYGLEITGWIQPNYDLVAEVTDENARRDQLRYAYILQHKRATAATSIEGSR